jgi:hypothetical protein
LPESLSPDSSAHLNTATLPTLESRAVGDKGLGTHGDLRDGTTPLDSQLWDDVIMPFYDVESHASQNPMVATTKGFAVAASSPPAARSNMWTMLQSTDEMSSGYMAQAMHESAGCSYSDTFSYPSMRNSVGSPEVWDTAPPLYPYSSQMSNPLQPPPVPEFNCSEADHALLTSVNAYPQAGGQWPTGYEYNQATTLCPMVNIDQTTDPNTFHTGGTTAIVDFGSVLSSESTIDNSYRDEGVFSTGSQPHTGLSENNRCYGWKDLESA